MKLDYCEYCKKIHELDIVEKSDTIEIKGEEIIYLKKEYFCNYCKKTYITPELEELNQLIAKDEYRKKHHLLTSNEIKKIREKYSLSQSDLALILGWGEITITRYETKEIQNEKYDNILRKIDENPYILYDYFEINKDSFQQKKQIKIYQKIIKVAPNVKQINLLIEQSLIKKHFSNDPILKGNTDIKLNRILALLKYIVDSGFVLTKTKVGQILWYNDMLYFQKYNYSMTGLSYFKMKYGMCPLGLDLILDSPSISIKEIIEEDYMKIVIASIDIDYYLTPDIIEIIKIVINKFKQKNTGEIMEYIKKEIAYNETKENEFISFEYARIIEFSI